MEKLISFFHVHRWQMKNSMKRLFVSRVSHGEYNNLINLILIIYRFFFLHYYYSSRHLIH